MIYLIDREHHSFFFSVSNPNQTSDYRTYFNFSYLPQSDVTFKIASFNNDISQILNNFQGWVEFIREYNSLAESEEDFIVKQYEDEFYHEFEIVDDDAYTRPFEHEKQVFIYKLLENIELELEKQNKKNDDVKSIISEVQELKGTIQNLTKKNVIKKLSKIFAKIKKSGIKLFKEILNETRKEFIKRAISGSIDGMDSWIHQSS